MQTHMAAAEKAMEDLPLNMVLVVAAILGDIQGLVMAVEDTADQNIAVAEAILVEEDIVLQATAAAADHTEVATAHPTAMRATEAATILATAAPAMAEEATVGEAILALPMVILAMGALHTEETRMVAVEAVVVAVDVVVAAVVVGEAVAIPMEAEAIRVAVAPMEEVATDINRCYLLNLFPLYKFILLYSIIVSKLFYNTGDLTIG